MPFIGNQPALSYTSFAKQDFTTSATTSYTLDNPVTNANELALFFNFVRQDHTTAYSASGTSITLWTFIGKFLRKFATNEKFIKYFNYVMSVLLLLSIITFYI